MNLFSKSLYVCVWHLIATQLWVLSHLKHTHTDTHTHTHTQAGSERHSREQQPGQREMSLLWKVGELVCCYGDRWESGNRPHRPPLSFFVWYNCSISIMCKMTSNSMMSFLIFLRQEMLCWPCWSPGPGANHNQIISTDHFPDEFSMFGSKTVKPFVKTNLHLLS